MAITNTLRGIDSTVLADIKAQGHHFIYIRTEDENEHLIANHLIDMFDDLDWNTEAQVETFGGATHSSDAKYSEVINSVSNRKHNFEVYGVEAVINVNPVPDQWTYRFIAGTNYDLALHKAQTEIAGVDSSEIEATEGSENWLFADSWEAFNNVNESTPVAIRQWIANEFTNGLTIVIDGPYNDSGLACAEISFEVEFDELRNELNVIGRGDA